MTAGEPGEPGGAGGSSGPKRRRRRGRRRRPQRGRAIFLLPNLVTTAALMLGFWSIILSIGHNFDRAALCIVLAGFADMADGRIARATHSTSAFGVEYDSMSDLVSFGLAPALLMYNWTLQPLGQRGWMIAALFTLCAAMRLARFNVKAHVSESTFYEGVPSTFAGGMVAASVWFITWLGLEPPFSRVLGIAITTCFAILAVLMVSALPYPSLKLIRIEGRGAYPALVAVVLFGIALLLNHEWMFFALGLAFIASGPVVYLNRRRRGEPVSVFFPIAPEQEGGDV